MSAVSYPSIEEVLEFHKRLIERFGGAHGIRDPGALEAALIRPQLGYYNDLKEQGAALLESLVNNHPFVDGNKRVAFVVVDVFFRSNGFCLAIQYEHAYQHWSDLFEKHKFRYKYLLEWIHSVIEPI